MLADELVVASDELPESKAYWADTLDSPGPAKYEDWCVERILAGTNMIKYTYNVHMISTYDLY